MPGKLSIVMAQLNLLVGDIEGNTERIIAGCSRAIAACQADIVIFPELSLTGYPPEDLLLRPSMRRRVDKALDKIRAANLDTHCVLGFPGHVGSKLFNTLAVMYRGKMLASYHKQYLPNYQVFDEQRYFTAGSRACVLNIRQQPVAFTICEDLWQAAPVSRLGRPVPACWSTSMPHLFIPASSRKGSPCCNNAAGRADFPLPMST